MSQYRKAIQIRLDDPICSVSALEGTVIGILFEKKGKEIQDAIRKRIGSIDGRVSECELMVGSVREFLKDKERQVEALEELHTAREDEKRAKLRPMEREIQEVCHRMNRVSFEHNAETEKLMAQKATTFVDRFGEYKDKLKKIDEFLHRTHDEERVGLMASGSGGSEGPCGFQGPGGSYGAQGPQGSVPERYRPDNVRAITKEEDQALSRLTTLKGTVQTYVWRVEQIMDMIGVLNEEKRRLLLIERNLDPGRVYKLDLNKLSAFGFEDVELK